MAGKKKWLEKIKGLFWKPDFDESKFQCEENLKESLEDNELPDLITPTSEEIEKNNGEEAKKMDPKHENSMNDESTELNKFGKRKKMKVRQIV